MGSPNQYYLDCQPIFDASTTGSKNNIVSLDANDRIKGAIPYNLSTSYDIKQCVKPVSGENYESYGSKNNFFDQYLSTIPLLSEKNDKLKRIDKAMVLKTKGMRVSTKYSLIVISFVVIISAWIIFSTIKKLNMKGVGGGVGIFICLCGLGTLLTFYFMSNINLRHLMS